MSPLKKTLTLLNASVFLRYNLFLLPVLFLFYQEYGLTVGDFFLLQGIHALTALLLDVPSGYLADMYSKKKILIFSGFLLLARFMLLYFIPSFTVIFVGEILFAAVIALFVGTSDSYIYEALKSEGKTARMLKRYGRMYFWVSLGTSVSSLSGAYLFDWYGAKTVILITMIFVALSTALLFFLPDIPSSRRRQGSLSTQYRDLFAILGRTLQNPHLRSLMFFAAFLTACYQILMWNMQPLMKLAFVPVGLFGVIFFFNHLCRAGGSYFAGALSKWVSMPALGYMTYFGFLVAFVAALLIGKTTSVPVNMTLLGFICLVMGLQVAFLITAISTIHTRADSSERATLASMNSMCGRFTTALCLILSKFIMDGNNLHTNLLFFMALFLLAIFPLRRFISESTK